jgi:hypothetical protein
MSAAATDVTPRASLYRHRSGAPTRARPRPIGIVRARQHGRALVLPASFGRANTGAPRSYRHRSGAPTRARPRPIGIVRARLHGRALHAARQRAVPHRRRLGRAARAPAPCRRRLRYNGAAPHTVRSAVGPRRPPPPAPPYPRNPRAVNGAPALRGARASQGPPTVRLHQSVARLTRGRRRYRVGKLSGPI